MNIFQQLAPTRVDSNTFDLSYDLKLTMDMGTLIPIHCQDLFPGDKITMSTESLLRFAPLIAPVMHKIDIWQHYFFVPNRIIWSGWEDFITGNDDTPPAFPYLSNLTVAASSLADYLGCPLGTIEKLSALPFAAYQRIYNEYYRDEFICPEITGTDLLDGDNSANKTSLTGIRRRAWEHDYFTAALPFAQKGDPVTIPLGDFNNVTVSLNPSALDTAKLVAFGGGNVAAGDLNSIGGSAATDILSSTGQSLSIDPRDTLYAETSELAADGTINDLRRAIKLQEWLEKNARGGTRYIESIAIHFGVKSSDARLQRPQYLGGSKQPMVISEVLQTSATGPTDDDTPQGNMSGHGISVGGGKQFTFFAEEHGYVIGVMSIRPKTAYQQGLPKHFFKFDKFDYPWPSFAHLGEQEIKNRELYYATDADGGDVTFGYIPRYSEYRYLPSRVAGEFRTSLSYWHLGRIFTAPPALNQTFIECNPSTRIFAVEDAEIYDTVYAHVFHRITATRKLPKYAIPEI